ncbi:hypothetical protein GT347_02320 [Xylophilus rhododendri]|uniref:Uncharacterized protein n=1 Tax=Xylophilus rhododendri TaxID=2697032 RepID=A0A857J0Y3_9BURK|nr:hypothetical protein [Xylophilus rhododendri]QHI96923.1 hypothetical protein GT347_02320 [Xylophilus rhododendri]
MSFNPALNASTPGNTGFAAIANLALGLLARNPGQPRTENMEPERSSLLQQYPEIGPDIAGLLSINARSNTTISSDHGPSVDADKGAGEIKRSGRAKRASKELQARIDTAMRFTLAGFRKQFGQIEPNLVLAPGSFEKRMFETGEVYGGHSAGWLNKDEYEIMKTPALRFRTHWSNGSSCMPTLRRQAATS